MTGRALRARLGAVSIGAERAAALRYAALVLVATRLALWLVALFAEATTEPRRNPAADIYDDPALTGGLPEPADTVFGVWARWDAVWYLRIAEDGYDSRPEAPAFFPLYPLLIRGLAPAVGGTLVAAVVISLLASFAAFYLLHRLATHEAGTLAGRRAVLYLAVSPMALFLAAAYGEALFLALALASVWAARRGVWWQAGLWGGLAALSRPTGLVLLVPLAILLVSQSGGLRKALHPRALWLALVPAGTAAYSAYLWIALGDPLRFASVQDVWNRETGTPLHGLWDALSAGVAAVRQFAASGNEPDHWLRGGGEPIRVAALNLELLICLAALIAGTVLVFRTLPRAYGWFCVASILVPLSTPSQGVLPLLSLPRFGLVLFPIFVALAIWAGRRPGVHTAVLASFPLLLGLFTAQWATWQWVS